MTYLFHGGSWLLSNQIVNFVFSLLLVWVFANLLSQAVYGQYRFLITMMSLFTLASLPGMGTAIVRAVARGNAGIIPEATRTRLRWGILGSLCSLVVAGYYFFAGDTTLGSLFLLIALFVPFYESFTVAQNYYNGRKNYRSYTIVSVIRYATIITATTAAVLLHGQLFVIVAAYIGSTSLINFLIYIYLVRTSHWETSNDTETIPYGKKLTGTSVLSAISAHLDKVMLWYFAGPVQVAMYTISMSLPKEITSALNNVGKLALPKMASRDKHALRESLLRKFFVFFIATIPIYIAYIVMAPLLFKLFLPQYLNTLHFSQLAALLILFSPLVLFTQYFNATMHVRALYIMEFIQPTVSITLYCTLIPAYGVLGAVLAFVGKQFASLIMLLFFFVRDRAV
ncbi:oligosaccharide flippase family protein [Candidatus Nomurabacteria bacterium]|nr:oligosaccharide flippase family protein [Candidatus Nomurabacteria bacterium]